MLSQGYGVPGGNPTQTCLSAGRWWAYSPHPTLTYTPRRLFAIQHSMTQYDWFTMHFPSIINSLYKKPSLLTLRGLNLWYLWLLFYILLFTGLLESFSFNIFHLTLLNKLSLVFFFWMSWVVFRMALWTLISVITFPLFYIYLSHNNLKNPINSGEIAPLSVLFWMWYFKRVMVWNICGNFMDEFFRK